MSTTVMMPAADAAAGAGTNWLARLPVPVFGIPMGLLGTGLVWGLLHDRVGTPEWLSNGWLVLGLAAAIGASVLHLAKAFRHTQEAQHDWHNAGVVPFYAQIPVTLLLIAEAAEAKQMAMSAPMLAVGSALSVLLCLELMRRWLSGTIPLRAIHSGWAIPGIALLVAATLWPRHGQEELAAALIGIAVLWFGVTLPAIALRLVSGEPAPPQAQTLPAILVAVPAVALLTWQALNPQYGVAYELVANGLMAVTGVLACMALARLPMLVKNVPFGPWWWAYGMPMAALALATIVWAPGADNGWRLGLAVLSVGISTLASLVLVMKSLRALMHKHEVTRLQPMVGKRDRSSWDRGPAMSAKRDRP